MKTNKEQLMKHFASVLRGRANGKIGKEVNPLLLRYFSRKELIEVIKKVYDGNVPKDLDIALMENEELLKCIDDEMYIIAFVTDQWSKESSTANAIVKEAPASSNTAKESQKKKSHDSSSK